MYDLDSFSTTQRLYPIHEMPGDEGHDPENWYYPINSYLVGYLLGQILTQVEASVADPEQRKAHKDIYTKMVWDWFNYVKKNSRTASPDSKLLPIHQEPIVRQSKASKPKK